MSYKRRISKEKVEEVEEGPKVEKEVVVPGDGVHFPKRGDTVRIIYDAYVIDGSDGLGIKVDSSRERGNTPYDDFIIGSSEVIKGLEEVIYQMSRGERSHCTIQASLAYGMKGVPPLVPPNAAMNYDVEVLCFENRSADHQKAMQKKREALVKKMEAKEKKNQKNGRRK